MISWDKIIIVLNRRILRTNIASVSGTSSVHRGINNILSYGQKQGKTYG